MYKVFIKEKVIYLTSEIYEKNNTWFHPFESIERMNEVIRFFINANLFDGLNIIHNPVENIWEVFQAQYKIIQAAGGLVTNSQGEYLFIFRQNRWDLPKGKLEKGEQVEDAAIREVKEECGIEHLILNKKIKSTFHIYKEKGEQILKETHWFEMQCHNCENPKPQLEEKITKACWLKKEELNIVLENTYGSINDIVLENVLNSNK